MSLVSTSKDYSKEEKMAKILNLIAESSPYLNRIILDDESFIHSLCPENFTSVYESLISEIKHLSFSVDSKEISQKLRQIKKKISLLLAVADLSKEWDLTQVTLALSRFADICLQTALTHLLKKYEREGKITLRCTDNPQEECGITVIGMGKLGAKELNYSSDIDLIYLFDANKINYSGNKELGDFMIKFARELTALIDQRDKDGYVFRVDLRIRPDPLSTPIIMTVNAAENYYEYFGQNWERAAMIKARPVAGDIRLGKEFISRIYPFIWRRSLDFKAINDIKDIKKQISSRLGEDKAFTPFGYNIKLGKGGIREIEFFAQVQQLIWGARLKELQVSDTLSALARLAELGYISETSAAQMQEAYIFFRNLEHRLQMQNDEQTHSLPKDSPSLTLIAKLMDFPNTEEFLQVLQHHLDIAAGEFSKYFFEAKSNPESRKIISSAPENDNSGLEEISRIGFSNPEIIRNTIQSWASGLYRSTRSRQAQEVLPAVIPKILNRLGFTDNPDSCFYDFDALLRSLPSGVQLLPLLHSRPEVLEILIKIIALAPALSATMQKYPIVIEDLINPDFFLPLKIGKKTDNDIPTPASFESRLNALQLWVNSKKFQAGVHLLTGLASGNDTGTFIAETAAEAVEKTARWLHESFAENYGIIPDSKSAILLLGRNGSGEAILSSDLDIIFIYDYKNEDAVSSGKVKLDIKTYYGRFVQRYINTLTSVGRNGKIWEVDMRLRPSGNSGPLATGLQSFIKYQEEEAWTWEHMALTKAKMVYGNLPLPDIIRNILARKRNLSALKQDILAMREKISKEHKPESYLDLKNLAGGMTDIEFIAQYLQLAYAYQYPDILQGNTLKVLTSARDAKLLKSAAADFMISFYQRMLSLRALYALSGASVSKLPKALNERLNIVAGSDKSKSTEDKIMQDSAQVQEIFKQILEL